MAEQQSLIQETDSIADIKKFLGKILHHWHWFVISIGWAILIAFLIIRYQTPVYVVNASIITKKFQETPQSVIPGLVSEAMFKNQTEVYQEIPLLKSYDKIHETLKRLDFGISYFVEGNIKTSEIFPFANYRVVIDSASMPMPSGIPIYIEEINNTDYRLKVKIDHFDTLFSGKTFKFGTRINENGIRFIVFKTEKPISSDYKYYFIVENNEQLTNLYRGKLNIAWQQQGSAILMVNIESPIPQKELDFVKEYFNVVIEKGIEEKNKQASNILLFIDQQMKIIGDSLFSSLEKVDNYKLENRVLVSGSDEVFKKLDDLDELKAGYILSDRYFTYLENYVRKKESSQVFAPYLLGIEAPMLDDFVKQYISLKLQDKIYKNSTNELNPLVVREDDLIAKLERNILENISNLREANFQNIRDINEKIRIAFNTLRESQRDSREYTKLQKQIELNESLYSILLEKRTEASIARASTISDYEVVEIPSYSKKPVSPDVGRIYLFALVIGLGLPLLLIYLSDILNNKIISRDDLVKVTSIPIVGHIGHSSLKTNLVVKENPKSLIAEAFRTIRANLQYFIGMQEKKCNIFMITSCISDEGKTFTAINMAYIFALSGKKTLLLGADLRKPSLAGYVGMKEHPGLSNFLAGLKTKEEVILTYELENLKVILAGEIPPNPSELLASEKMANFITELKKEFDYIIIDTPPIGVVSDAFELLKYSDFSLLVVRQGKTIKTALAAINEMYQSGKIKHIGILFNDVDFRKLDYSYGYGYGYSYRYGYYYGYGYGYFDEENKKKGGIFNRTKTKTSGGEKRG